MFHTSAYIMDKLAKPIICQNSLGLTFNSYTIIEVKAYGKMEED